MYLLKPPSKHITNNSINQLELYLNPTLTKLTINEINTHTIYSDSKSWKVLSVKEMSERYLQFNMLKNTLIILEML